MTSKAITTPTTTTASARPGFGRGGWTIAAAAAALLTLLCLLALLAELYGTVAAPLRIPRADFPVAQRAAAITLSLVPWKAEPQRARALILAASGADAQAVVAAREALRWAPAEAESWRTLARVQAQAGEFGPPLDAAVAQAQARAPWSLALNAGLAMDALDGWADADDALRARWLASLRLTLARAPYGFLRGVALAHRENRLCYYFGDALHLEAWCRQIGTARQSCLLSGLTGPQRAWCDRAGLYPASP